MKKINILAAVAYVLILSSCKKPYTCECTTIYSDGTVVSKRDISKTSKKTAKAICGGGTDVYTETYSSGSGTSGTTAYTDSAVTSCELK